MKNLDIIFETNGGSYLYGTNLPSSDLDRRGVCMEPRQALLGLSPFEQFEDNSNDQDRVIYGLRKFTTLALGQNPNIVELLYAPLELDNLLVTKEWMNLVMYRELFLSRKVADTFVGYAVSQLKRMETHYRWMTIDPPEKPDPMDYGRVLEKKFGVETAVWINSNLRNEYDNKLKAWQQYNIWIDNRNIARHNLEEEYGYDTKNAMHLVRLLQQGEELLKTGFLKLPRPNARELLDIRRGSMKYEEVIKYMETKKIELDELKKVSVLPEKPDFNKVENLIMNINEDYLRGK